LPLEASRSIAKSLVHFSSQRESKAPEQLPSYQQRSAHPTKDLQKRLDRRPVPRRKLAAGQGMHFASIATVLRMCKDLPNLFYLGHENNYSEIVVVLLLVLMHLLLLMTMRIAPMKVIMIAKSRLRSCLQVV